MVLQAFLCPLLPILEGRVSHPPPHTFSNSRPSASTYTVHWWSIICMYCLYMYLILVQCTYYDLTIT